MPSLGADMDAGTLLEWLVAPGDHVTRGDVVAVVDTDKTAVEVETFTTGTVDELVVQPGTKVPVGTVLALIRTESTDDAEAPAPPPAGTPSAPPAPAPAAGAPPPNAPPADARPAVAPTPDLAPAAAPLAPAAAPPVPPGPRRSPSPVATPPVRRLAAQLGVDLARVRGTGHSGAITHADVQRAAAALLPEEGATRPRVSPYARRLADELGVAVENVPTGPDGTVHEAHVRAFVAGRAAAAAAGTPAVAVPVPAPVAVSDSGGRRTDREHASTVDAAESDRAASMRAAIARAMSRSKREIPHYYLSATVDLTAATRWLQATNRALPVSERIVMAALLLSASARAAAAYPSVNGHYVDDTFRPAGSVHLGVAVALRGGGLLAPAIHDAQDLPVAEVMARLRDLVARTRAGRLRRDELADPTLTVTNLGEQGVESVLGVIHPPQVAIVGFGRVVERPWAVGGLLGVAPVVTATLAADHRVSDGYTGARYLAAVDRLLQSPEEL
jgi:pyruvate dehydrogenase E2 component (dihydrolipoamide acetyltransferase)